MSTDILLIHLNSELLFYAVCFNFEVSVYVREFQGNQVLSRDGGPKTSSANKYVGILESNNIENQFMIPFIGNAQLDLSHIAGHLIVSAWFISRLGL